MGAGRRQAQAEPGSHLCIWHLAPGSDSGAGVRRSGATNTQHRMPSTRMALPLLPHRNRSVMRGRPVSLYKGPWSSSLEGTTSRSDSTVNFVDNCRQTPVSPTRGLRGRTEIRRLPPARVRDLERNVLTASGPSALAGSDVPGGLDRNEERTAFAGREPRLRNLTVGSLSASGPRIKHNVAGPSGPNGPPRRHIGVSETRPDGSGGVREEKASDWKGGQRR